METLLPKGWQRPKGYSNGIAAEGRLIFVAGQIGWNEQEQFESRDFVRQLDQALANTVAVLAEAAAGPEHIVRMTWYIIDKTEYLAKAKEAGLAYRARMGKHYPAMSVVEVTALMEDEAKIEIESTAVVPVHKS